MLIGEHGKYPRNDRGQTLYPRYEFFQQIVDVFRASGRAVPVFNDKHLSWRWDWAKAMVDTARTMGFPFMAGSSLPVTWRIPSVDLPWGAEVEEVVCVGYGGLDSYDFHGLETLQCMVERRRGGETGVAAVQALRGDAVWKALAADSWAGGGCSRALFETCLCRSFTLTSPRPGYGNVFPELGQMPGLARSPFMYRIEYADGLKGTLVMLTGLVKDFTVAVADQRPGRSPLDPDVSSRNAPWPDAAQLLQSPVASHRDHVPDRKAPLPRRADPADDGHSRGRNRLLGGRTSSDRDAPPLAGFVPGDPGIDVPEELIDETEIDGDASTAG